MSASDWPFNCLLCFCVPAFIQGDVCARESIRLPLGPILQWLALPHIRQPSYSSSRGNDCLFTCVSAQGGVCARGHASGHAGVEAQERGAGDQEGRQGGTANGEVGGRTHGSCCLGQTGQGWGMRNSGVDLPRKEEFDETAQLAQGPPSIFLT